MTRMREGRHRAAMPTRTLHLIDLENLVGGHVSAASCGPAWNAYERVVGVGADDQIVVAAAVRRLDHNAVDLLAGLVAIPRSVCRVVPLAEPDAAETALIASCPVPYTAQRFGRVVIASGDHKFADYAQRLRAAGVRVEVATGVGFCAARLHRVAQWHYRLFSTNPHAAA